MLREKSARHFEVTCVGCGWTREFCARGSMGFDGRDRAIGAFKRAGWVCAMPQDHGMRQRAYEDALRRGEGQWTCPECARLRSRSA